MYICFQTVGLGRVSVNTTIQPVWCGAASRGCVLRGQLGLSVFITADCPAVMDRLIGRRPSREIHRPLATRGQSAPSLITQPVQSLLIVAIHGVRPPGELSPASP